MTGQSPPPVSPSASLGSPSLASTRARRVRSRGSTLSSVNGLAPIMSRENSRDDAGQAGTSGRQGANEVGTLGEGHGEEADYFATRLSQSLTESHMRPPSPSGSPSTTSSNRLTIKSGRKPSKSVSASRPPTVYKRTQSYHHAKSSYAGTPSAGPPSPSPNLMPTPVDTPSRNGLKRRTSTPSLAIHLLPEDDGEFTLPPPIPEAGPSFKGKEKEKEVDTRARSKSTSIAYPPSLEPPTIVTHTRRPPSPLRLPQPLPEPHWTEKHSVVPTEEAYRPTEIDQARGPTSLLIKAYDFGESSISRLARWIRPGSHGQSAYRRRSSEDSERGLSEEDNDPTGSVESVGTTRASTESYRAVQGRGGKYWGISDEDDEAGGYFSLPPTPPEETANGTTVQYPPFSLGSSLPTPALSAQSLSRPRPRSIRRQPLHRAHREDAGHGWLKHLLSFGSGTKTGQVIRELGWTVGILVMSFLVTLGLVLYLVRGMPITTLKHLPQSTTDLQLLSAEIRSYMSSGDSGWYHTIGVLIIVGCWKHAWSVPGAVVLNILVGSILEPVAALALLTFITATGSLLSYLLSRPLAPLIAVLFPKPLALVRAALAPESIPSPPASSSASHTAGEHISPVQYSSDPSSPPVGGDSSSSKQAVWRRLLVMRAMGFVPWSGMNVACGVVGVNWKTFWLTTAAGSASWSYVTASVGNILSRLALPRTLDSNGNITSDTPEGESLTSLLRDPVLIAKLVFLTGLTLLPVVVKRRRSSSSSSPSLSPTTDALELKGVAKPLNPAVDALRQIQIPDDPPMSPITQSLTRFTPTPAVFDLLSFGRTAIRQSGRLVQGGVRGVMEGAGRAAAAVRG